ncbi:MAG: malonyl-CoA decarboxylase [Hyphomicrobiales bacterium]|nr:malonyl-CoA decarboxylase [Hyphomicrobiales bacterium]
MSDAVAESLIDRALRNVREGWREIADAAPLLWTKAPRPNLPDDDADQIRRQMTDCLEAKGGEVSARARAASLGETYLGLNQTGRKRFLGILARDFDCDYAAVAGAAKSVLDVADADEQKQRQMSIALRSALEPPRRRLLTQFNGLPEGVKFLVDLRSELLEIAGDDAHLRALEGDLKDILRSWFDVGFLDLQRITWDSPAALLEKLIAYEAVHEIQGWADLKNRLGSDRRCFAFFHNRMPDEPIIFVEVALVEKVSGDIQELLDEEAPVFDPQSARTAIFYSISNAQKGLAGISFGDFLIKRVVDHLAAEFKTLRTFATLSPIPGFMAWLRDESADGVGNVLDAREIEMIGEAGQRVSVPDDLIALLALADWRMEEKLAHALKAPLMRACGRYLLHAKRPDGRARDPVANFHLNNGARVETLNWLGDVSDKGMRQSAGMMVNYLYRLDQIESNHEAYRGSGAIAASSAMRSLAKERSA